jgi:hypothetical protein
MKVNISGVGLIPKVGLLAPVYGKDLTKDTVNVILKYASFKVYVAATGIRITKKNIDVIFGTAVKQAATPAPTAPKKTTKKAPKKAEAPVEIEQVSEPVVLDTVVEAPAIEEPVEAVEVVPDTTDAEIESSFVEDVEAVKDQLDEVPADEGFPVDDIVDEDTPAEEETNKPVYTSKKKKRR